MPVYLIETTIVQDFATFWKDIVSSDLIISNPYDLNITNYDGDGDGDDDAPRQLRNSQDFGLTSTLPSFQLNTTRSSQFQLPPLEDSSARKVGIQTFGIISMILLLWQLN